MENLDFECKIEIQSEPDDQNDEFNETETACVTRTDPRTSSSMHNDENFLLCDSRNIESEGKESEILPEQGEKKSYKDRSPCQNESPKPPYRNHWTDEEYKKLEELLVVFPYEEIKKRRYEKIACFLKSRSPLQIAIKVQKCYKKLKKKGITVSKGMLNADHVKKSSSCIIGPNPNSLLESQLPPMHNPYGVEEKSNLLLEHRKNLMKHSSFYWTDEEQKKLDDLLIQFPPEEDESSRWEKIALHLETRSSFQIADRVKYLKQLIQNNKFVPGKIPGVQFNEISSEDHPRYSNGRNIKQYWTPDEQKRLEELLLVFPSEKYERQRHKKIAFCLGNRTASQVGSRIKTYFLYCKKYGLPFPGEMPRHSAKYLKVYHKRSRKVSGNRCAFLKSHQPSNTEETSVKIEKESYLDHERSCVDNCSTFLESHQPSNTEEISVKIEKDLFVEKNINQELEKMEWNWKEKQNWFTHTG